MEVSLSEERHSLITTGGGCFQDGLTFSLEQGLLTNNSDVSSRSAGALTVGDAPVSVSAPLRSDCAAALSSALFS